jgi:hypothetical protein
VQSFRCLALAYLRRNVFYLRALVPAQVASVPVEMWRRAQHLPLFLLLAGLGHTDAEESKCHAQFRQEEDMCQLLKGGLEFAFRTT